MLIYLIGRRRKKETPIIGTVLNVGWADNQLNFNIQYKNKYVEFTCSFYTKAHVISDTSRLLLSTNCPGIFTFYSSVTFGYITKYMLMLSTCFAEKMTIITADAVIII